MQVCFNRHLIRLTAFCKYPTWMNVLSKPGMYHKSSYQFALDYEKQHPGHFQMNTINLPYDSINTAESEYFPSLTIDGKHVGLHKKSETDQWRFFHQWKTKQAGVNRNRFRRIKYEENEGTQNISQDGTMLVFTGCNMEDGAGSCDLYVSYLKKMVGATHQHRGNINTEYWESQPSFTG